MDPSSVHSQLESRTQTLLMKWAQGSSLKVFCLARLLLSWSLAQESGLFCRLFCLHLLADLKRRFLQ